PANTSKLFVSGKPVRMRETKGIYPDSCSRRFAFGVPRSSNFRRRRKREVYEQSAVETIGHNRYHIGSVRNCSLSFRSVAVPIVRKLEKERVRCGSNQGVQL